jgi:hypothetical protein
MILKQIILITFSIIFITLPNNFCRNYFLNSYSLHYVEDFYGLTLFTKHTRGTFSVTAL